MNVDDRQKLDSFKDDIIAVVNKDIALAISSFKVWLMATVLSNVILIGIPALFVFFTTQTLSATAFDLAKNNASRLDERSVFISQTYTRLERIEDYLERETDFEPSDKMPSVPK